MERVDRAVKSEAKRWYAIVRAETVLGIAGAVTTGLGTLAGVILTTFKLLKAAQDLDPEAKASLLRRVVRRDEWFMSRLGDTASHLVNAMPTVQRLWGVDDERTRNCTEALVRMRTFEEPWPSLGSAGPLRRRQTRKATF
jgi:hypothetical protein